MAEATPLPVPDAEPEPEEEAFDLDLDAYRAAQAEQAGKPRRVRFGGEAYEFPPEWPVEMGDLLTDGLFAAAVRLLLGEEQGRRFMAVRPPMTLGEFTELTDRLYAAEPGESPASSRSSKGTSGRSRPTSNGSTRSTSARRAGARKR
jgi:hypothetical protein